MYSHNILGNLFLSTFCVLFSCHPSTDSLFLSLSFALSLSFFHTLSLSPSLYLSFFLSLFFSYRVSPFLHLLSLSLSLFLSVSISLSLTASLSLSLSWFCLFSFSLSLPFFFPLLLRIYGRFCPCFTFFACFSYSPYFYSTKCWLLLVKVFLCVIYKPIK